MKPVMGKNRKEFRFEGLKNVLKSLKERQVFNIQKVFDT